MIDVTREVAGRPHLLRSAKGTLECPNCVRAAMNVDERTDWKRIKIRFTRILPLAVGNFVHLKVKSTKTEEEEQ